MIFDLKAVVISFAINNVLFTDLQPMGFDIFFPCYALAFEYQGEQHYYNSLFFGSCSALRERDKQKREACVLHGITLIEVPFSFKLSLNTLISTISNVRPDLIEGKESINENPPF